MAAPEGLSPADPLEEPLGLPSRAKEGTPPDLFVPVEARGPRGWARGLHGIFADTGCSVAAIRKALSSWSS